MSGNILKRDKYYMDMAFQAAKGSKCVRAQYGTVIVSSRNTTVTTGYNGKPAGSTNDHICYREGLPPNAPKENCCLHSEDNAISFSNPADRLGGTMYVSGIPCNDCALKIMQCGVARLVFFNGASASGHRGCSDDSFWDKYGSRVIRVPFTFEEWEELYGDKGNS